MTWEGAGGVGEPAVFPTVVPWPARGAGPGSTPIPLCGTAQAMNYYLQYFNVEKMGRFPNGAESLLTKRMGVYTKLATVQQARGSTVFVIAGFGKPKRYYLW